MPADTTLAAPPVVLRPPRVASGPVAWLRDNLFSSIGNTLLTLIGLVLIWKIVLGFLGWAVFTAVWWGEDGKACVGEGKGACWPFIFAKLPQFFYGRFPDAERWRVKLTYGLFLAGIVPLMIPAIPGKKYSAYFTCIIFPIAAYWLLTGVTPSRPIAPAELAAMGIVSRTWTVVQPVLGYVLFGLGLILLLVSRLAKSLMMPQTASLIGGVLVTLALPFLAEAFFTRLILGEVPGLPALPMPVVKTELWGGLLVTLVVATVGIALSYPVGIVLALGRRSRMPIARWASVFFIEVVRAVPLITILFMSSVMLPLFLPDGVTFDKLLRALVGVALFAGAYMAETIRGGLQAIPRGQFEAADALGLSYGKKMGLIVLPQALKLVIPGLVNSFVGLFKDTSLVLIIGLFDLLGIIQFNLTDPKWFAPQTTLTAYVFCAIVFWMFCFSISRYSQWLEGYLRTDHK